MQVRVQVQGRDVFPLALVSNKLPEELLVALAVPVAELKQVWSADQHAVFLSHKLVCNLCRGQNKADTAALQDVVIVSHAVWVLLSNVKKSIE